jgi:hypothetical protein
MKSKQYWCVAVGLAWAASSGCSSQPLQQPGGQGAAAMSTEGGAPSAGVGASTTPGGSVLSRYSAGNSRTLIHPVHDEGGDVLVVGGQPPFEIMGPSFPSTEVGDAVVVDLRPPTLSANPAWTGELQVFVADPSAMGGKRYVGGQSLTPLPRGLTSRLRIPIRESLKPLFEKGGQISFVLQAPLHSPPFFLSRVSLGANEVKSALPSTATLHVKLPKGASFANTALLGATSVDVRDGVTLSGSAGLTVASTGTTNLGADSLISGNVVSVGTVSMGSRATVQGNVTTEATLVPQTPFTVSGSVQNGTSVSPPFDQALTVEYPASSTPLNLEPNQRVNAGPGAYTTLNLKGGSKLTLSPGDYFFDSASLESTAEVHVSNATQPVVLHVKDQLTMRGLFPDALPSNILWVVSGTSPVEFGAPLVGTVVAPNADVRLGPTNGGPHHGAVFAKSVSVEARSPFQLVPFSGWEQLVRPVVPADAAPSAAFRARWVYPNGQPIESFSYGPAPTQFHVLALGQPGESPTTALSFEVQNLSQSVGGIPVAFSVTMKSWGLGNLYFDVPLRTADPSHILAPGAVETVTVSNLASTLGVKASDMPAKGDIVVSLFKVTGGVLAATPFAFLRMPQFFYHFTDDLTQVFTYSLERASDQLAPSGMVAKDGVVERYAQGVYHANLFAPNGMLGNSTAEQARANLLTTFGDRPAQLYGIRWDATPAGSAPGNVIPPGATPGGTTEAFNPNDGPTGVCATWPTVYVDNGDEPFPARSQNEFKNIVDFLPAAFNRAQLFKADGTLIADEHFNASGCFNDKKQLGKGNYLLRVFSTDISNNGVRFNVTRFEPPQVDGSDKDVSVTYALLLNSPGHTAPAGDTFVVTTGMWTETTHLTGFASHLLARDAAGVDFGLTRGTSASPKVYPIVANTAAISAFDGARLNINAGLNENSWVTDARWKFVLAHEFGHMVQAFAGAQLPARYAFIGNDSTDDRVKGTKDPASASATQTLIDTCTCNLIEDGNNRLHCLQSVEVSASAQQEAFGHFMATRTWNKAPIDAGYDGSCHFTYYKQVGAPDIVPSPALPPVSIDCSKPYKHRKTCAAVTITLSGVAAEGASEVDWLTFFRALTTSSAHPVGVADFLGWYTKSCGGSCANKFVTYQNFHDASPVALQSFVDDVAVTHGVK